MPDTSTSHETPAAARSRAQDAGSSAAADQGRYGLPASAFERAWTVEDIRDYLQIGRTQAYELVKERGFPPRLRTGRSHRWNGLEVLAWVHGPVADATRDGSEGATLDVGRTPVTRTVSSRGVETPGGSAVGGGPSRPVRRSAAGGSGTEHGVLSTAPGVSAVTVLSAAGGALPSERVQRSAARRVVDPDQVYRDQRDRRLEEIIGPGGATADSAPMTRAEAS